MAGTNRNYDVSQIHQGPGDLWIIGTPPVDSATPQLTIAADGTPDATAHPNSVCLGFTESGINFTIKQKIVDIGVDQFEAPVDSFLEGTDAMIEAEMAQQSADLLQQSLSTGVYTTASAYKQVTFGGISIIPVVCIAAISPKRTGSGLFLVSMLFRVASKGGIQVQMARAKKSMHKVQFSGQTDITRAAGRNIGVHYETK